MNRKHSALGVGCIIVLLVLMIGYVSYENNGDKMGLSQEIIDNPGDLTAEETVRMFYYYYNQNNYDGVLSLAGKDSNFYKDVIEYPGEYGKIDDDENVVVSEIMIKSINEDANSDGVETYYVQWKFDFGNGYKGDEQTYFDVKKIDGTWKIIDSTLYV